jgi:hypothetical protein
MIFKDNIFDERLLAQLCGKYMRKYMKKRQDASKQSI